MAADRLEVVYGLHSVRHAFLQSPDTVLEVLVSDNRKSTDEWRDLENRFRDAGIRPTTVPREELDRLSGHGRHQGIVLKRKSPVNRPGKTLDELLNPVEGTLLLILDGVQDPHNLGACIRSANAAGARGVIVPRDRAAPLNATVSKVASGGAEHTPVIRVANIARSLRTLKEAGVWITGTDADAGQSFFDIDMTLPTAIVLGAEGSGLRRNTKQHCDHLARLPMHGEVESLNVSVAAGVCLYEALRQREFGPGRRSPGQRN